MQRLFETKQEFLAAARQALKDGTMPSIDDNGTCQFLFVDGQNKIHKCVAGLMVPEDLPVPHNDVIAQDETLQDFFRPLLPRDMSLEELYALQSFHDSLSGVKHPTESFEKRFLPHLERILGPQGAPR